MKKPHNVKSWRKVAAWMLAITLAFGLMPTAAFAINEKASFPELKAETVEPKVAAEPEAAIDDIKARDLDKLKLGDTFGAISPLSGENTIPKSTIDATKPKSLPLNGKTYINGQEDTLKYYRITLTKAARLNMSFTELNTDDGTAATIRPRLTLYGLDQKAKKALMFDLYMNFDNEKTSALDKSWFLPKGTYYLQVDSWANTDNFYITTKTTQYNETIKEAIPGTNETYAKARLIKLDKTYTGLVATLNHARIDEYDWFKFTIPYPTSINIKTSADAGLKGNSINVYHKDGSKTGAYIDSAVMGKTSNIELLKKGTYVIRIVDSSDPYNGGKYTLNITKGPKLTVAKNTHRLKWAAVKGADKYEVWRSTGYGEKFKRVKILNSKARSYTAKVPRYDTHYYKIRAIDGSKKGPWSITYRLYSTIR